MPSPTGHGQQISFLDTMITIDNNRMMWKSMSIKKVLILTNISHTALTTPGFTWIPYVRVDPQR